MYFYSPWRPPFSTWNLLFLLEISLPYLLYLKLGLLKNEKNIKCFKESQALSRTSLFCWCMASVEGMVIVFLKLRWLNHWLGIEWSEMNTHFFFNLQQLILCVFSIYVWGAPLISAGICVHIGFCMGRSSSTFFQEYCTMHNLSPSAVAPCLTTCPATPTTDPGRYQNSTPRPGT